MKARGHLDLIRGSLKPELLFAYVMKNTFVLMLGVKKNAAYKHATREIDAMVKLLENAQQLSPS